MLECHKKLRENNMSFFTALFYDSFMAKTEKACLTEWRGNLLKQVYGNVLENLSY
jgi:hypothetical protein